MSKSNTPSRKASSFKKVTGKPVKCWQVFNCNEAECPAYKSKELACWLFSHTHCRNSVQGGFLEKLEMCRDCTVFYRNMDIEAVKKTVDALSLQLKDNREIIGQRDKEIEDLSLELAFGISEVLEALKQISLGNPSIRISESSDVELIAQLKKLTNKTAEEIEHGVTQFHEFAIGLAEHFDVLHRVAKGDRSARVSGQSQDELLKALGDITNQMIESVSHAMGERVRAEERLRAGEEKYRVLIENIPDIIWTANRDKGVMFVSSNAERILGYTSEEICSAGDAVWFGNIHPDHARQVEDAFDALFRKGNVFDVEYRIRKKTGEWIWVSNRASINIGKNGAVYAEGLARDITVMRRTAEELKVANEKMSVWVNELEERNREISLLGEMGNLLQSCLAVEEAYAIISGSIRRLFPSDQGALYVFSASRNIIEAVATWGDSVAGESVFAPDDCWSLRRGRLHLVEDHGSGLLCRHLVNHKKRGNYLCVPMQAHGEMLGMLHLQSDTEPKENQKATNKYTASRQQLATTVAEQIALALANLKLKEKLKTQSIRDPLTGLFNRRYMEESLERELQRITRKQGSMGVIMLDVDHFKRFNDLFGHATGDALLRELGIFLKTNIRAEDIACRYGGEEFAVILPEASLEASLERAENLREGAKHLNVQHLGQSSGPISISLGLALFPRHGLTAEKILQSADAALYRAKAEGRDRVVVAGAEESHSNAAMNGMLMN